MRTAGEILAAARKKKGWDLEELARRTKIQENFLEAIEESRFDKLPQAAFVRGLVQTTAAELGLDPAGVLAVLRRDFHLPKDDKKLVKITGIDKRQPAWTPQMTTVAAMATVVVSFLGYLGWQLLNLNRAPLLILTQPAQGAAVRQELAVEGKTGPGATVTINGQEIRKNKDGSFSQILSLTPGEHTITVTAVGQNGKKATEQRTVRVK